MANVIYLEDHRPGVTVYYPELGDRKPEVKMEASAWATTVPTTM